jgi:hypothetical protein
MVGKGGQCAAFASFLQNAPEARSRAGQKTSRSWPIMAGPPRRGSHGDRGSTDRPALWLPSVIKAAALLHEKPNPELAKRPYQEQPYWEIERARIGDSREVPVELVVTGYPVAKQNLLADGVLRDLTFEATIERSSWLAVRILPSSYTNPVWVLVGGKPVRVSRRGAEWCLKGVDRGKSTGSTCGRRVRWRSARG